VRFDLDGTVVSEITASQREYARGRANGAQSSGEGEGEGKAARTENTQQRR
jgi:sRNA-binding protein